MKKGRLAPFYLLYGPGEFRLENTLQRIREEYVPEGTRDFNLEIFYGDESDPGEIVNRALSLPFMAPNRLIIVRRTENFRAEQLERFLPYLDRPADSTCLLFVASRPDFRLRFFKKMRSLGRAVLFDELKEAQIPSWLSRRAGELGLNIDREACAYLQQIVGNSLRELNGELEKLLLRFGGEPVGMEQVRDLAIHSRVYTIFELVKVISMKDVPRSLGVLQRFLDEEDKRGGPLRLVGMLNRQVKLLWKSRAVLDRGGHRRELAGKLGPVHFLADELLNQAKKWTPTDLERALELLYRADGHLKSGSRPRPILENLILSLCG
ncbi:MAG: DNA polymerase III subunit delta [Deltaproteobacteria bacterium]|nr:DNA polymerase III subunit delta [Deltaproteobacteria bacterium]